MNDETTAADPVPTTDELEAVQARVAALCGHLYEMRDEWALYIHGRTIRRPTLADVTRHLDVTEIGPR